MAPRCAPGPAAVVGPGVSSRYIPGCTRLAAQTGPRADDVSGGEPHDGGMSRYTASNPSRRRRVAYAAASVTAAGLLLAATACSSDDDAATPATAPAPVESAPAPQSSPPPTTPPPAPTTPPPPPTTAAPTTNAPPTTTSPADEARQAMLSGILESHRAAGEFVGASIAVQGPDGSITEVTSGTQTVDPASPPVDVDVPWNIGSATKIVRRRRRAAARRRGPPRPRRPDRRLLSGPSGRRPDHPAPVAPAHQLDSTSTSTTRRCAARRRVSGRRPS